MFDGLLKSKFYSKCKSAIKHTKTRLEMIKRKRKAMQKYLRNDLADLLRNDLDVNAYGRAEGLLVELNLSACYSMIEEFCGCILDHLSLMNKQRECPEECRQAVSSLMFAAARFADLPELRELRTIFTNKYGHSIEAYVNQEFVDKLKAMPPSKEMKLQLLQEIALESGLQWDSKALEQKLYNPPPTSDKGLSKKTKDDKHKLHKGRDESVQEIDSQDDENKHSNPERNEEDIPFYERKIVMSHKKHKLQDSEDEDICGGNPDKSPSEDLRVGRNDQNEKQKNLSPERSVSEEKAEEKKPFYYRLIPPPYTKARAAEAETAKLEAPSTGSSGEVKEITKLDESIGEAKPKPRSVRRIRSKPPPDSNIMKLEDTKLSLKTVNQGDKDQTDEEERMMDRLLKHYSTKPSACAGGEVKAGLSKPTKKNRRAASLSVSTVPTSPTEKPKGGHARASSFQADTGHANPKLLDYDDFVARLAALRGK